MPLPIRNGSITQSSLNDCYRSPVRTHSRGSEVSGPLDRKLPTRFTILTNELPHFGDSSGAIASRFLVLRLVKSSRIEDTQLAAKLLEELPENLNWKGDHYGRALLSLREARRALLGRSPSQSLLATSRRADEPVLPDSTMAGTAEAPAG